MRYIRFAIIFIFAILSALPLLGQMQQGVVKTRGRMINGLLQPGKGLNGATIQLGDRSVLSKEEKGKNGVFSFPTREKHYVVKSVLKNGYQLVDMEICRSYNYSTEPLYIVMETPDQQRSDLLTAERKIRRNLQQQLRQKEDEIESLKVSQQEKDSLLCILYLQHGKDEKLIADMAKRYSTLDYDQLDEFYRQVSYYIENGELSHADSLLRTRGDIKAQVLDILQHGKTIKEKETQLQQAKTVHKADIDDAARRCYCYFETFSGQNQTDSAAYYIELRAKLDSTNAEWQNDAGDYIWEYYNLANYMHAWRYFMKALENSSSGSLTSIKVLCNLGKVFTFLENDSMAFRAFDLALDMALTHDNGNSLILPVIYESIGNLYIQRSNCHNAIYSYEKALCLYSRLYGYKHYSIASTYYKLGNAFFLIEKYNDALKYEFDALEIIHNVRNISGKNLLKDIYALIGDTYQGKKEETLAYSYWEKSLKIRAELQSNDLFFRKNSIGTVLNANTKDLHEEDKDVWGEEKLNLLFDDE